jgi:uncharacterized protein (UPF0335 family)
MTLIIKSYTSQMTYDITDAEKMQAEKALLAFDYLLKYLRKIDDHMDIMYTPFKDNADISTEEVIKFRAALRRYRDKVIENFNNLKVIAFKCITLMQTFSSDTQTSKLMKSFISSIEDIETQVNNFSELFDNLKSKTFVADVVKIIDLIKKELDQLKEIVDGRIKAHIKTNILNKTWADSLNDESKIDMNAPTPIFLELNKERQELLGLSNDEDKK